MKIAGFGWYSALSVTTFVHPAVALAQEAKGSWLQQSQTPSPAAEIIQAQFRPVDVTVNQAPVGQWTLLEKEGAMYAPPEALKEWRLLPPQGVQPLTYRRQTWIPLFALPGYRARFDQANQALALEFAPSAFEGTQMSQDKPAPPALSATASAFFLNYDLSHVMSKNSGAASSYDSGALTELGLSLAKGTLISSQVGQRLSSSDPLARPEWKRLETTWTRDFRDNQLTLRVGDTSTRSSMWSRSVYFGGLQIGTNYGLTPGFITQAIPTLSGTATGPSTVELYVNNVLRQTSNVQAGPFTIENFNQLTGAGDTRIVVRDVLGRETVVTKPFLTNARLLETGLSDWGVSLGRQRYNLGTLNADYRDRFASSLYRRGINKELTLEGSLDMSQTRKVIGIGSNAAVPFQALFQSALAVSEDRDTGRGAKLLLAIDQQSLRSGFGIKTVFTQPGYRELGFAPTELPYRSELSINARGSFDSGGTAGVSMAKLTSHDNSYYAVITLNYAMRVGERGSLYFGADRVTGKASGNTVSVNFVMPLDNRKSMAANVTSTRSSVDSYASANSPIDPDSGLGWRVLGGRKAGQDFAEGGLYLQGGRGYLGADVSSTSQSQVLRLNAQGAVVAMDGGVFASRRLQDSFALVEVKGYPDVGIGLYGRTLAKTNKDGVALIPSLQAYQTNSIRLNPNDLPFSAELDSIEQQAVPTWRSGVKVVFPVRSGRGALIRIVLEDGQAAPSGARIELPGDEKEFFVARRGEAFMTGLQTKNKVKLSWKGQQCQLNIELPPGQPDEIPRIGPLTCQGVRR